MEKEEKKCKCDCKEEICDCEDCKDKNCNCEDCNCEDEHHKHHKMKLKETELENEQKKATEYLNLAQRVQADFDNYRKRNEDLFIRAKDDGIAYAVENILPIVDSLTNAKKQVKNKELLENINPLYSQLMKSFEKLNIKKIDAVGQKFDPNFHNAIMAEQLEGVLPDIVLEEYQEGFTLNGKVLRPSVVKISK